MLRGISRLATFVSVRYLRSPRQHRFISVISLMSILGIAIGVASLIVVISVMNGFDRELMHKIMGMHAHLSIYGFSGITEYDVLLDKVRAEKGVVFASPAVIGQVMIRHQAHIRGIVLKGIDFDGEKKISALETYLKEGQTDTLPPDGVILGRELADILTVKIGDAVDMVAPVYADGLPIMQRFVVSAIFESGMYDFDASFALVGLQQARALVGLPVSAVSHINIRLADPNHAWSVKDRIKTYIEGYPVQTWLERNRNLFSALKLEKTVMFVILTLIILVAAFNIITTLIMVVMEKTKDIGILKALGASPAAIMLLFSLEGTLLGVAGTATGLGLGLGLCALLKRYNFIRLPDDIYYVSSLPVAVAWKDVAVIVLFSLVISVLAALYPAYKAARLNTVEALRYE